MRIVHLVNHCDRGGNVIVSVDLACEQAAHGHSVVYASEGGRFEPLLASCGVKHLYLPHTLRSPLDAARSVGRLIGRCREFGPDVLHAHMMSGAVVGYVTSRILGIPLVTTVHNSFETHSRLMRLGDHVVAVSNAERQLLLARGYPADRLHIVQNGTWGSRRENDKNTKEFKLERPCLVTVCGLEKRKGVDDLIDAFRLVTARAPDWRLYIVGDGPERGNLEKRAALSGFADRIIFLGFVDSPKPLLESADIFVLASHAEPFGLSIAEARQAGCAVVCSNVGGIPEVLEFGEAGDLVPPANPARLASSLAVLMTDDRALAVAKRRAKNNSEVFNVKRMFTDYMAVYQRGSPRRRPLPSDAGAAHAPALRSASQSARLKLAVGVATAGRPAVLAALLRRLKSQSRQPDAVVVCVPTAADVDGAAEAGDGIAMLIGPRGSSHQRNAILQHAEAFDVVVFFDDDFVPAPDYLANVEWFFLKNPDVVMTTGCVIRDGIIGPGLSLADADKEIARDPVGAVDGIHEVYNAYGCNMGIRLEVARRHGVRFDERLPLYAWLEDIDFSRQIAGFGRIVKVEATRGVHLGVKQGRQSGLRAGYSQIANPLYLINKGTLSWSRGVRLMSKNLVANTARSLRPEPWIDRRGRLIGNLRAIFDLFAMRLSPGRVLTL